MKQLHINRILDIELEMVPCQKYWTLRDIDVRLSRLLPDLLDDNMLEEVERIQRERFVIRTQMERTVTEYYAAMGKASPYV
jgi:hypothetical protein